MTIHQGVCFDTAHQSLVLARANLVNLTLLYHSSAMSHNSMTQLGSYYKTHLYMPTIGLKALTLAQVVAINDGLSAWILSLSLRLNHRIAHTLPVHLGMIFLAVIVF